MKVFYMGRKLIKIINGRSFKRGAGIDVDEKTGTELLKGNDFDTKLDKVKLKDIEVSIKEAAIIAEAPLNMIAVLKAENETLKAENETLKAEVAK